MPSTRLQIRRSWMQTAHSSKPAGVGAQASKAAPLPANSTLSIEIWFGVIEDFANDDARRCAQALLRVAIGRRLSSVSTMCSPLRQPQRLASIIAYNGAPESCHA